MRFKTTQYTIDMKWPLSLSLKLFDKHRRIKQNNRLIVKCFCGHVFHLKCTVQLIPPVLGQTLSHENSLSSLWKLQTCRQRRGGGGAHFARLWIAIQIFYRNMTSYLWTSCFIIIVNFSTKTTYTCMKELSNWYGHHFSVYLRPNH